MKDTMRMHSCSSKCREIRGTRGLRFLILLVSIAAILSPTAVRSQAGTAAGVLLSVLDIAISLSQSREDDTGFRNRRIRFDDSAAMVVGDRRQVVVSFDYKRPGGVGPSTHRGYSVEVTVKTGQIVDGSFEEQARETKRVSTRRERRHHSVTVLVQPSDVGSNGQIRVSLRAEYYVQKAGTREFSGDIVRRSQSASYDPIPFTVGSPASYALSPGRLEVFHGLLGGRAHTLTVTNSSESALQLRYLESSDNVFRAGTRDDPGGVSGNDSESFDITVRHDLDSDCACAHTSVETWYERTHIEGRIYLENGSYWTWNVDDCWPHTCCPTRDVWPCGSGDIGHAPEPELEPVPPFDPELVHRVEIGPVFDPTPSVLRPGGFMIGSPVASVPWSELTEAPRAEPGEPINPIVDPNPVVDPGGAPNPAADPNTGGDIQPAVGVEPGDGAPQWDEPDTIPDQRLETPLDGVAIEIGSPVVEEPDSGSNDPCDERNEICPPTGGCPERGDAPEIPVAPNEPVVITAAGGRASASGQFAPNSTIRVTILETPFLERSDFDLPIESSREGGCVLYAVPKLGPTMVGELLLPDGRPAHGDVWVEAPPDVASRVLALSSMQRLALGAPASSEVWDADDGRVLLPLTSVVEGRFSIRPKALKYIGWPTATLVFRAPFVAEDVLSREFTLYNLETTLDVSTHENAWGEGQSAVVDLGEVHLQSSAVTPTTSSQPFRRGDANADAQLDIGDAVFTLGFLFLGTKEPSCRDAADSNADLELDLADAMFVLAFLFLGGPTLSPPTSCEVAETVDCDAYPPCET